MMSEEELRQLQADLVIYIHHYRAKGTIMEIVEGFEMAITMMLGMPDTCFAPEFCQLDHKAMREENLADVRRIAAEHRAKKRVIQ